VEFWHGELEGASADERLAQQETMLREQLPRALRSPFLRALWTQAGVEASDIATFDDLRSAPYFDKSAIIEAQAADPPYGSLLAVGADELNRTYISPGPEAIFFTRADLEHLADQTAWALHTNGVRSTDVVDVTPMYHWVLAGTMLDDGYRRLGCNVIPGGAGSSEMHVENMRWAGVSAIFAFPTFLEQLALRVEAAGLDPQRDIHLRMATIAGEMSSPDARHRMEEYFGCKVREQYGGAEIANVAAECEAGGGMHLNPKYLVEVLDVETGAPAAIGQPGVLVLSDLHREGMPILRYFTSDITAGLDDSPCPCGRTTSRIGRILGRTGEIMRIKGLFVVPRQVAAALEPLSVGRFQIVADRPDHQDRIVVRVESDDRTEERKVAVAASLRHHTRLTVDVELCPLGSIAVDAPVSVDLRQ
jgi:phenylacetate-CoA ligase